MQRYRWIVFVLALVVSAAATGATKNPRSNWNPKQPDKWIPLVDPKTRIILDLPFTKIITPRALLDSKLYECVRGANVRPRQTPQPATQPAQPAATAAVAGESPACKSVVRFACTTVHDVELKVYNGDPVVYVTPAEPAGIQPSLEVQAGSCIQFRVVTDDSSSALIQRIDFIDEPEEANATRKPRSIPPVGDQCFSVSRCVIFIGLVKAQVSYRAFVWHDRQAKVSADPDIHIACDDCGDLDAACPGDAR
jgi:hypothetical protein